VITDLLSIAATAVAAVPAVGDLPPWALTHATADIHWSAGSNHGLPMEPRAYCDLTFAGAVSL
jgi:hypothetical protein